MEHISHMVGRGLRRPRAHSAAEFKTKINHLFFVCLSFIFNIVLTAKFNFVLISVTRPALQYTHFFSSSLIQYGYLLLCTTVAVILPTVQLHSGIFIHKSLYYTSRVVLLRRLKVFRCFLQCRKCSTFIGRIVQH